MRVNWKPLLSLGCVFWGFIYMTDLLGDSTWKRCSQSFEDILSGQFKQLSRRQQNFETPETATKLNWPILLWNVCAFLCSLVFCSVVKSMSWVVWRVFKFYNVFRNRQGLSNRLKGAETEATPKPLPGTINKEQIKKEMEELAKEKDELSQQLVLAQKENLTARQQIEEYKLETFMMKEKLARTASTLKENLKYKDYASANQEVISRKAHNLELHLKEVSRDRDLLRSKLATLEKNYSKLEEKLKLYEKQDSESNLEQLPEKDIASKPLTEQSEEISSDPPVDICNFQKKIMELQKSIGTFEPTSKIEFQANSKISVDLDESSIDTSKDTDCEGLHQKKAELNEVKQNILNYNAYKAQMLRPKLKLSNIQERLYSPTDTTGSSSDDNSGPQRIISSTVEFQNFLKTLSANNSNFNFNKTCF
ncbi:golgin subfamily A member 5 [Tribolium castaneum]|uniref:Uncharacterized protein n=1 Tax=Tribolium castaneum TaxID=7070 RepID=A0A139WBU6_TRICA|nr:PREDICTED: golgin subfamily A member 5-like [Tribolium castaneum]KYB25394.1 hypothetical protein TcasGA2_TC034454 [Tribolium castaneum]|eukprot:XP_015839326.1 PREDICTED: golgin subfamily A member 5-like [Tribolium castaneum]